MASPAARIPSTWDEYRYGSSPPQDSEASDASHVRFERTSADSSGDHLHVPEEVIGDEHEERNVRRRRSSMSMRIGSLVQAGGVNSIENFARSLQRAAGFVEITPSNASFVLSEDDEGTPTAFHRSGRSDEEHGAPGKSLIRAQLESSGPSARHDGSPFTGIDDSEAADTKPLLFDISHINPQLSQGYEPTYGTLSHRVNESSMRHAARLFREDQNSGSIEPDTDREPLLVKRVEQDGKIVNVVVGQSTLPQTIFNSVNVLIGVGLLSLPLGVKYAGWLVGMLFFLFSAVVTSYTARILAKCLDVDPTLITFADIAFISFGSQARIATSILFSVELVAACVALVVLFADSLDALIPGWGTTFWKIICGVLVLPTGFLPLKALSFSSILGILCCFGIVMIVLIDGLIKPHTPGSLREPAKTYMFPSQWSTLPLSIGLLMSPWGGHSVFPNIYRDMRHPLKYTKAVNTTYTFTFLLDLSMAVAGLLMFGDDILDEVTSNILMTSGYPRMLSVCITIFVGIIPITKIPLNARPIVSIVEVFAGLDPRTIADNQSLIGMSAFTRGLWKFVIRLLIIVLFVSIAIAFPYFDRIMALLGSSMCLSICVILPLAFYLKLFGQEISMKERALDYLLIGICSVMAVIGTIWACLPRQTLGINS